MPLPADRWFFLDALRAALMLVGIPYHAARFFRADLPSLDAVATFSNVWRMTTFFVVAGFFALLVARRRGAAAWWRTRATRLGIPLIFCVVLLNPLQTWLLLGGEGAVTELTTSVWPWLHHAWFLAYLLLYCAAFALLFLLVEPQVTSALDAIAASVLRTPWTLAVTATSAGFAAYALTAWWLAADLQAATYDALTPLLPVHLLSFAAGLVLAAGAGRPDQVGALARGPVVAVALVGTWWIVAEPVALDGDHGRAVTTGVAAAAGLAWAALWVRIFARWADRDTSTVRWLVSASLPVYLLHHVVVFGLGPVVVAQGWHPWTGFAVLTAAATGLAFVGYELGNRWWPTRMLLSGTSTAGVSLTDVIRPRQLTR